MMRIPNTELDYGFGWPDPNAQITTPGIKPTSDGFPDSCTLPFTQDSQDCSLFDGSQAVSDWARGPEARSNTPDDLDDRLKFGFAEKVSTLNIREAAVPIKSRIISTIERYGFFALCPVEPDILDFVNTRASGWAIRSEADLSRWTFPHRETGEPFLDALCGLGLTYLNPKPWTVYGSEHYAPGKYLIAVTSACISGVDGSLIVRQLQDVTGVRKPMPSTWQVFEDGDDLPKDNPIDRKKMKAYLSTGLHNGLDWRKTLLGSMVAIARSTGIPRVAVQSHTNSCYPDVRSYGYDGYDKLAQDCGFTQDPRTKNWVKEL